MEETNLPAVPINNSQFEERRRFFYEQLAKQKSIRTPKDVIEEKGEFPYAAWWYMLEEIDNSHPRRAETFAFPPQVILHNFMTVVVGVQVVDIETGECRIGIDANPVQAWEKGSDKEKSAKSIANLIGNTTKGALTKALRNAYSNFGVCADLYQSMTQEKPTEEQVALWNSLDELFTTEFKGKSDTYDKWWKDNTEAWGKQLKETADLFLSPLKSTLDKWYQAKQDKLKEEKHGTE